MEETSAIDLRRPRGLAARATLFTCAILIVTAVLSAATVLYGAQRESARHQLNVTRGLAVHLASISGDMLAKGDMQSLHVMSEQTASRAEVYRVAVYDQSGAVIVGAGGTQPQAAVAERVAHRVLETRELQYERAAGGLAIAAPIIRDGQLVGASMMMWDNMAYRFAALPALAPFLLILAVLLVGAVPITAFFVRRAASPLDTLARFAERIAENGEAAPIELRTGDEFETLATAFNKMISRLDASMRQIQEIAFVDPVTRLPNHDRFIREIDFAMRQRNGADGGVVIAIELQRLPRLLQTMEPDAARDLLRVVADRLVTSTRTVDRVVRVRRPDQQQAMPARLAAAEFGVFVPEIATQAESARFTQHLCAALNQPFEWRGHKLTLGAHCGVALVVDERDADTVIRHARMALGAAAGTPARIKVFTQSLDREAVARVTMEREMRSALERNEFRAYFQPKINVATGKVEACEALARWVRPDRTIISPGRFIPVAEESGLIGALSDAIMREACWKAAAWSRAGHPAQVAVNVSALQFRSDRFADQVLRVVQHAGLSPAQLELEITESVVMEDPDRALRVINPLKAAGVRLAIDDFGCGHSSLAALSKLPFDVIKIDQQFIRALERGDTQAAAIVEMILALSRTLDMEVVAEGIERREDMEFVASRGCHWVQGFLFGAAMPAAEFAQVLRRQSGEDIDSEDAA